MGRRPVALLDAFRRRSGDGPACSSTSTAPCRRSCSTRRRPARSRAPSRRSSSLRARLGGSWWCPGGRCRSWPSTCRRRSTSSASTASRRAGTARSCEHPEAAGWRPGGRRGGVAEAVDELPDGVEVEHKGLSLTLHFRRHPEGPSAADAWAGGGRGRSGLHAAPGQDVRRAAPAGGGRQGHGGRRAGRRASTAACLRRRRRRATSRPSTPSTGSPRAGGTARARRGRTPTRRPPSSSPRPTCWSTAPRALVALLRASLRAAVPQVRAGGAAGRRASAAGVRASAIARRRAASSAPLVGRHRERLVQDVGGAGDVERRHAQRAGCSRSQAPASGDRASTASRSLTRAPSEATRFRPSRIGFTSSTSARRSRATERGWSSSTSSTIGVQSSVPQRALTSSTMRCTSAR